MEGEGEECAGGEGEGSFVSVVEYTRAIFDFLTDYEGIHCCCLSNVNQRSRRMAEGL